MSAPDKTDKAKSLLWYLLVCLERIGSLCGSRLREEGEGDEGRERRGEPGKEDDDGTKQGRALKDLQANGIDKEILELAEPYRAGLYAVFVGVVFVTFLSLLAPWPLKFILDDVAPSGDVALLALICLAMLCIAFATQWISYRNSFRMFKISHRIIFDLRMKVMRKLHELSLSYYDEHRVGEISNRAFSDVATVQSIITSQPIIILSNSLLVLGFMVFIFFYHWPMGLMVFAIAFCQLRTYFRYQPLATKAWKEWRRRWSQMVSRFYEVVGNVRLVKSFCTEMREFKGYIQNAVDQFDLVMNANVISLSWTARAATINHFGRNAITLYAGYLAIMGQATWGEFVVLRSYAVQMLTTITALVQYLISVQRSIPCLHRVFEVLHMAPEITDEPDAVEPDGEMRIAFRDVSFGYTPEEPVLQDISFQVAPGETIAVVGASGSGKSTLVRLLSRLSDPSSGQIQVGGHDLRNVKIVPYRKRIGTVLQENQMFSGTVRENLLYARPDASDEELRTALEIAGAQFVFTEFSDGLDTMIGEKGYKLSGGQRQRLAIARAIVRDPDLLILDEATSSLDTVTEEQVQRALEAAQRDRTTVVVAHRLSTIKNADKIIVLKDGRIVQIGSHRRLIMEPGEYRDLYQHVVAEAEEIAIDSNTHAPTPKLRVPLPSNEPQPAYSSLVDCSGLAEN